MTKGFILNRTYIGSIMAEAAFAIPILLGIVFFVIEFGTVMYIANSLTQIARSAARYASVTTSYTNQDLINATNAKSLLPDVSKLTLSITPAIGGQKSIGTTISVTAQYNYTPIINPFGLFKSSQIWAPVLTKTSVTRAEVASG